MLALAYPRCRAHLFHFQAQSASRFDRIPPWQLVLLDHLVERGVFEESPKLLAACFVRPAILGILGAKEIQ